MHLSAIFPRALAFVAAAAFVTLCAHRAHAQVEARCPPGWETLPALDAPDQRTIAACRQGPIQIVATEFSRSIPPNDPIEGELAEQMLAQFAQAGQVSAQPFRTENFGGTQARVADFSGTLQSPEGQTARIEGSLVLVNAGPRAVIIMALSQDPSRGNARTAVRAFVPTMAGLNGAPHAWRVSAEGCPQGMQPVQPERAPSYGMRRVILCQDAQSQLDVLESRLPVRALEDARASGEGAFASVRQRLEGAGGQVIFGPTQPATFGRQRGFVTPMHGALHARGPQGPVDIAVEGLSVVIPTSSGGHVRITGVMQGGNAESVANMVRTFVTTQLRTDGSGVPSQPIEAPATQPDASVAEPPEERPRRREPEIDPNAPEWVPPPVTPPVARERGRQRSGCGCSVQGSAHVPSAAGLALAAGVCVLMARREKRRRRIEARAHVRTPERGT